MSRGRCPWEKCLEVDVQGGCPEVDIKKCPEVDVQGKCPEVDVMGKCPEVDIRGEVSRGRCPGGCVWGSVQSLHTPHRPLHVWAGVSKVRVD